MTIYVGIVKKGNPLSSNLVDLIKLFKDKTGAFRRNEMRVEISNIKITIRRALTIKRDISLHSKGFVHGTISKKALEACHVSRYSEFQSI